MQLHPTMIVLGVLVTGFGFLLRRIGRKEPDEGKRVKILKVSWATIVCGMLFAIVEPMFWLAFHGY